MTYGNTSPITIGLHFDKENHIYRVNGTVCPSVTQILKPLNDFSAIPRQVLDIKMRYGELVHRYLELYDQDDLDLSQADEQILPIVETWILFLPQFCPGKKVSLIESILFSQIFNFAGTPDRIIRTEKADYVIDIKTSSTSLKSTGPQLAAYGQLAIENKLVEKKRLKLMEARLVNGAFVAKVFPFEENWKIFLCCLSVHQFLQK